MNWIKLIGNKSKIASQKADGRLDVAAESNVEIKIFSKTNIQPPRNAGDYEPRTTAVKSFQFPHGWTAYASEGFIAKDIRKIFDQSIFISSTLDAELQVEFQVNEVSNMYEVAAVLYAIDLGTIPVSNGTTPQVMGIVPEKTDRAITRAVVIDLPELRQPHPYFSIKITPLTAPTSGELKFLNTRRY